MTKVLGAASVLFSGVDDGVGKAANSSLGALKSFAAAGGAAIAAVGVAALAAGAAVAAIGVGATVKGVGLAAQFEQTTVAFEVLTGSAKAAQDLLQSLTNFAATTPFQMPGIEASARQLLAFQFGADEIVPVLRNLGDIAAGTGAQLTDLVQIYGRMRLAGKASMENINRISDRGIPILTALADQLGVSALEVRQMVSAGKIGFPEVSKALADMTNNGGMFEGMMSRQSTTVLGLVSTLQDNLAITLRGVGQQFLEAFNVADTLSGAIDWVATISDAVVQFSGTLFRFIAGPANAVVAWLLSTADTMRMVFRIAGATIGQIGNITQMAGYVAIAAATETVDRVVWLVRDVLGGWLVWLGENWVDVLKTMASASAAIFTNMWGNIFSFFKGVASWLSGDGFDWKWTGLLDGFKSTLGELPKIAEFEQSAITSHFRGKADAIGAEIGKAYLDALTGPAQEAAVKVDEGSIFDVLDGINGTNAGAAVKGAGGKASQDNRTGIAEAFNRLQDAALGDDASTRTATATEKTAEGVSKIAINADRQLEALREIASESRNMVAVYGD